MKVWWKCENCGAALVEEFDKPVHKSLGWSCQTPGCRLRFKKIEKGEW